MDKDNSHFWLGISLVILRWKRFLLVNVLAVAVLVAGISLLLPNWYRGEATILPPENQSQALNFGGLLPDIIGSMELPVMASLSDVIGSMAESRAVVDSVIRSKGLMEKYGTDNFDVAVRTLRGLLDVTVLDNGMIQIGYLDKDPERAAEITNEVVSVLDAVNRNVRVSKARNSRDFIESRLADVVTSLRLAEDSLTTFQVEHRALAIDEQTKAQIEIVASLEGERVLAEVELEMLRRSLSPNHPEVRQRASRVAELSSRIRELESGSEQNDSVGVLRRPMLELPALGVELARLIRNVKVHETVYELLTGQLEQAKIEESKTTPTLSILSYASVPELKFKPKRSILVLLAAFISALLSLLWIWLIEFLTDVKGRDRERFEKWRMLLDGLYLPRFSKRLRSILHEPGK